MEVLTVSFIGKRVRHSKFGEGTITQQDAACITVRFIANPVPKKFIYPSCFKTFLTLLDASAATEAKTALAQHEAGEKAVGCIRSACTLPRKETAARPFRSRQVC